METRASIGELLRRHWIAVVLLIPLGLFWISRINDAEVCCDAYDNLRMAVSLAHEGVMSLDAGAPYRPTMYREPLPPLLTAGMIRIAEWLAGPASFETYQIGNRASWLKYQNLLWMAMLCCALYIGTWRVVPSKVLSIGVALVGQAVFFYRGVVATGINTLFTEIMGTAILVIASVVYADAMRTCSWRRMAAAGLLFGALTLVKAVFFPVCLVLFALTPAIWACLGVVGPWDRKAYAMSAMILLFGASLAPWMLRNGQEFDTWKISDRGGYSLYTRAIKDDAIWPQYYAGAFYAWTPSPLKPVVGAVTGYQREDMQLGGPLQQFNRFSDSGFVKQDRMAMFAGKPEAAISYYYKGRAEWERQKMRFRAAGRAHPEIAADRELTNMAVTIIRRDPVAHAALILPLLWRGALFTFPLILVSMALAVKTQRPWMLAYLLPSFGMIMFYACVSNFEERYGVPAMPVTLLAIIYIAMHVTGKVPRVTRQEPSSVAPQ